MNAMPIRVKNRPGGLCVPVLIGAAVEFTQSPTPTTALMLASKDGVLDVKTMFLLSTIHCIMAA